jgi:hypothetical protein
MPRGRRVAFVLRVAAEDALTLSISAGGLEVGAIDIPAGSWVERAIDIPASEAIAKTPIEVIAKNGARFSSFHYWLYAL